MPESPIFSFSKPTKSKWFQIINQDVYEKSEKSTNYPLFCHLSTISNNEFLANLLNYSLSDSKFENL